MKRLLIVDDSEDIRKKYSAAALAAAEDLGIELIVHTAEGVVDGLQKASETRYDCAIVDKDMPDGTGNDFAKGLEYKIPLAGITGSTPEEFEEEHFRIRLSKSDADAVFPDVVKSLLDPTHKVPRAYVESGPLQDYLVAADIMLQGYIALTRVAEGQPMCGPDEMEESARKVIEADMKLEDRHDLLDLADVGISPDEFSKQLAEERPAIAADKDVQAMFESIREEQYTIPLQQAERVHELFYKALGGQDAESNSV